MNLLVELYHTLVAIPLMLFQLVLIYKSVPVELF